jgi:hypothetical protein
VEYLGNISGKNLKGITRKYLGSISGNNLRGIIGEIFVGYLRRILEIILSAFRDRGVPKPTSECAACPSPDGSSAWASAKGGEARWKSRGLRVRPAPRSGALAVGGLQASTRVREASSPKRAPVSSSSPRGQPSLRRPWSFLL